VKKLNGLVRQYLPNGSSFADLTQERLNAIGMALKERARKGVNYQFFAPIEHNINSQPRKFYPLAVVICILPNWVRKVFLLRLLKRYSMLSFLMMASSISKA